MKIKEQIKKASQIDLNKSYKTILKPVITEKATRLSEFNKVVFLVAESTNKLEVKYSIEKIFSVKVRSVNIINIKGKSKRFKGIMGKRKDIKNSIVTLETGNTIDLSAGV